MHQVSLRQRFRFGRAALRARAIDRAVHAFTRARFALLRTRRPGAFHVAVQTDLRYRDTNDPAHTLDVYMPTRGQKPLPTLLYVHGGGFAMLSKDTHRVMALSYARRGYLVFIINYRLGPKHLFPAPLEDAAEALIWVRDNCAYFGGDPSRLAVAGESAVGQPRHRARSRLRHPCAGPSRSRGSYFDDADVKLPRHRGHGTAFSIVESIDHYGERHPRLPRRLKDMVMHAASAYVGVDVRAGALASPMASPLLVLERATTLDRPLPPFFADAGTRDPLLGDSRRLKAAVERHGSSCDLHIAHGEIHGYVALVWRPRAREKGSRVHDFLRPLMRPMLQEHPPLRRAG